MRIAKLRRLLALCFLVLGTTLTAQEISSPAEVIRFPDLHAKHHEKAGSGRFKDIAFGGSNVLWMMDEHFLWRWNYLTNSLKRIGLVKKKTLDLQTLARVGKELIVFADKVLYLIDVDTLKIKRVANPSRGPEGPVWVAENKVFWSDKSSNWQFDIAARKLKRIAKLSGIRQGDIVYHSPRSGVTLLARNNLIIKSQAMRGEPKRQIVQKTSHPISDVFVDPVENIYFVTRDAVIRADNRGEIVQVVPAVEQTIGSALIQGQQHLYFLPQSQTLEFFDVAEKLKTAMRLSSVQVRKLALKGRFVALLAGDRPEIFLKDKL